MNLDIKITNTEELLAVKDIAFSAFFKECENRYGKLNDDTFWKYREHLRCIYTYKEINIKGLPFHFLHYNKSDPSLIAFTANDSVGKKDGKMFIKPGKYLAKHTNLNNEQIKKIVTEYKHTYVPPELHIAKSREEIIKIYNEGPNSCMSNKSWKNINNPVQVYFGPDTEIAYIKNKTGDGYSARTILVKNNGEREYINIYGDVELMRKTLNSLNIKQSNNKLSGCRLPVVWKEGYDQKIILVPYMDSNSAIIYIAKDRTKRDYLYVGKILGLPENEDLEKDYFRLTSTSTNGSQQMEDTTSCRKCSEIVFSDESEIISGRIYCKPCLENIETVIADKGYPYERKELLQIVKGNSDFYLYKEQYYSAQGLEDMDLYNYDGKLINISETALIDGNKSRYPLDLLLSLETSYEKNVFITRSSYPSISNLYLNIETLKFFEIDPQNEYSFPVPEASRKIVTKWRADPSITINTIPGVVESLGVNTAMEEFLNTYCHHYNNQDNNI